MSFIERISHPVESFRTAPVSISAASANIGMTMLMTEVALVTEGSQETLSIVTAGATAALALKGIQLASKSFKLRNRLENSIESTGFNDRIFATTTRDWCTRQAAIVACEQYDKVDQYQDLCEQTRDTSKVTFLPQI